MNKRLRRSLLYVPGNNPAMVQNAYIYKSDAIVLDLEDSVSLNEKDAARHLVYNALISIDYEGAEMLVRINDPRTETGKRDLEAIVKTGKAAIRLPKAESREDILYCDGILSELEKKYGLKENTIGLMAAVETAKGAVNVNEIAGASKRLMAISLGAEDFVTDLGTTRSKDGSELLFARSAIVLAAKAAGIDAIDTVYSDTANAEGFEAEARHIKQLGFAGKSVINPKQIKPLHHIFNPTEKEIEHSLNVMYAIEEAERKGSGVIALDGKMIDKPVVKRAEHLLTLAKASGLYREESYE